MNGEDLEEAGWLVVDSLSVAPYVPFMIHSTYHTRRSPFPRAEWSEVSGPVSDGYGL